MVQPIPAGYHNVTPYLIVRNAAAAIDFYKKALNAVELALSRPRRQDHARRSEDR